MDDGSRQISPILLGEFLDHLKVKGFDIGVDDYLRVQQLFVQPGLLRAPVELKLLLCPLFATSEKQQKQFYEIFEAFFGAERDNEILPEPVEPQSGISLQPESGTSPARKSIWQRDVLIPAAVMAAVFLAGGIWLFKPRNEPAPPPAAILYKLPLPTPTMPPTPLPPKTETIRRQIGQPEDLAWKDRVLKREPVPKPPIEKEANEQLRQNWKWLVLAAGVLPLLAVAMLTVRRRSKRRQLQSRQSDKHPPFTWPLVVPKTTQRLHEIGAFNAVTRALRRRQQGELMRLDVEGTISATIAGSGLPALKFRPVSKVPEYLILIDRATLADHQARFFDDFVARLQKEDVFVERYFYDGDPRVCYGGDYRKGILLEDLPRHGHRLLVYGDGTRLLAPDSGELADWTEWFAEWDDRALLTPVAPKQWGLRERKLSELFLVLPATLEGLREAISHFELRNQPDLRAWQEHGEDREKLPVFDYDSSPEQTAEKLEKYLADDNLFQWVCACAAYPTLQWDLTLCLGQEVMPGRELWEKDILRLARLPWFQQGAMPESLRHCLLRRLTAENQRNISAKLIELLQQTEKALPEKFDHSWAAESLSLQIEIQQWLADRSKKHAAALRRKFRELPPSLTAREYATLREVDAEPLSPPARALMKRLPEDWRARLFPYGLPPLRLKTAMQLALVLPLALLLMISIALLKPQAQTMSVPQTPTEEDVTILARPTPERSPSPTPTASPTPPGNGEIQLAFDRSLPASINLFIIVAEAGTGGKQSSFERSGGGSALTLPLLAGRYKLIAITEVRRIGEPQESGIQCTDNIQVFARKRTVVPCRVPSRYQDASTSCFSPNAEITIEKEVPPDTSVTLYANVQGGQNYGNLSFSWTPSAGRISSGVSRSGQPIYLLDTQGVAPGTTINLNLRVTSSLGNCVAFAQASVRIRPLSTPTQTPVLMPAVTDRDVSSARQMLESLGLKLQVDEQAVSDSQRKPGLVARQEPNEGTALSPGQRVTLYVARQEAAATCYAIRLDRVGVIQDGEVGSPMWSFDIFAGETNVIALPARRYSDREGQRPPSSNQSASRPNVVVFDKLPPGNGCVPQGQPLMIRVAGINVGENDPEQRAANGNQSISPSTQPVSATVSVRARNEKDGAFLFYFTITPTRAPSAR